MQGSQIIAENIDGEHCCVWDVWYLWFFQYMDGVHVVLHGVDDDKHVSKLGGDDPAAVVSGVL